ncbi:carbon-nitrogen hydrolase family protein [Nocardioides sp.]|uniref:carbon-nitrogen hydrolase family protein n=1 Tax=Nocardioides sp. TaxID=35761 RepID=UPI003529A1C6
MSCEPPTCLQVSLVQAASGLEPADNRALLDRLTPAGADLVVFPEAFARDFGEPGSDVSGEAEPVDGPFATEVARVAQARRTTIVAGMFETSTDPARPFNTLVARGAVEATYRKIHLYDSFGFCESDRITAGPLTPQVVDLHGFRVGLMTCYDLRFPELARELSAAGAEVLVLPAAWVAGAHKVEHWRTLARARAIENVAYVVAVGQPGPRYTGHSLVVDPWGEVVVEAGAAGEVLHATLERAALEEARAANPSLGNRRL